MTQTTYNSHEHLIKIKGKDGQVKDYLPANWRLHELRVTCPTATIESEIVFMDQEHNFVIIKAVIYDGTSYEESSRRASSMKQGLLTSLDKVETGAKSRAARDFGIGTEFALEAEPEEDLDPAPAQPPMPANTKPTTRGNLSMVPQQDEPPPEQQMQSQHSPLVQFMLDVRAAGFITGKTKDERTLSWEAFKMDILGTFIRDEDLSDTDMEKLRKGLAERKKKVANKK